MAHRGIGQALEIFAPYLTIGDSASHGPSLVYQMTQKLLLIVPIQLSLERLHREPIHPIEVLGDDCLVVLLRCQTDRCARNQLPFRDSI